MRKKKTNTKQKARVRTHFCVIFFSQDVSTYLFVNLLFLIFIFSNFFSSQECVLTLVFCLVLIFFFSLDVSTTLFVNLLFLHPHLFFPIIFCNFFFIPRMCPHLSLLFVVLFFSQDVSTYLFVNLLFFASSSSIIFCNFFSSQECVLTLVFCLCYFFLSRCLHISLCKSFVFTSSPFFSHLS